MLQTECSVEWQRLEAEYQPQKTEIQYSDTEWNQKEVFCTE